jgi:hypothetical protein
MVYVRTLVSVSKVPLKVPEALVETGLGVSWAPVMAMLENNISVNGSAFSFLQLPESSNRLMNKAARPKNTFVWDFAFIVVDLGVEQKTLPGTEVIAGGEKEPYTSEFHMAKTDSPQWHLHERLRLQGKPLA